MAVGVSVGADFHFFTDRPLNWKKPAVDLRIDAFNNYSHSESLEPPRRQERQEYKELSSLAFSAPWRFNRLQTTD
jgi:hypothetical protein